jgi:hypothetical protein
MCLQGESIMTIINQAIQAVKERIQILKEGFEEGMEHKSFKQHVMDSMNSCLMCGAQEELIFDEGMDTYICKDGSQCLCRQMDDQLEEK